MGPSNPPTSLSTGVVPSPGVAFSGYSPRGSDSHDSADCLDFLVFAPFFPELNFPLSPRGALTEASTCTPDAASTCSVTLSTSSDDVNSQDGVSDDGVYSIGDSIVDAASALAGILASTTSSPLASSSKTGGKNKKQPFAMDEPGGKVRSVRSVCALCDYAPCRYGGGAGGAIQLTRKLSRRGASPCAAGKKGASTCATDEDVQQALALHARYISSELKICELCGTE